MAGLGIGRPIRADHSYVTARELLQTALATADLEEQALLGAIDGLFHYALMSCDS